jgi:dihydroorotase
MLIQNGRVIDPSNNIDDTLDILIQDGKIAEVGKGLKTKADATIDAKGKLVTPGLVDIHVHLRDPGLEYKEDIISGTASAAAGGFTSIACMPNTKPVIDNKAIVRYVIDKAKNEGTANVFPVGSITKGSKGETLAEMGELKDEGCVGFSDDGGPVSNGEIMRRALEYARPFNAAIISHAEDLSIVAGGVMNDGHVSAELGLKGIPWVAEDAMTARDVMLAEFTGGRLHIAHISTKGAIEFIRQAKKRGVNVTCEATPHHFTLTDEAVRGYNTNAKMNPPLRSSEDMDAVRAGLADGTIDAIATDHAPHHIDEKNVEFAIAMNGIVGLETALPLTLNLVTEGVLTLNDAIAKLTSGPCQALDIPRGTLGVGAVADIAIIDPDLEWSVSAQDLVSKSKNTPFDEWNMKGAAVQTILAGKTVYTRD